MRATVQSILTVLGCATQSLGYVLKEDFTGNGYRNFFDKFEYWTAADPTKGFIDYVNQDPAWQNGLIGNGGNIYIGVDHTSIAPQHGRKSLRMTSKSAFDSGTLIVADISHMVNLLAAMDRLNETSALTLEQPDTCGTWPALWTTSQTSHWPQEGEIDIIEQANGAHYNQMSIHLSEKQGRCHVDHDSWMRASRDRWGDCSEESQRGCNANDPRANSFGGGFNRNGGGVYAMEWTWPHIRIWFFPRHSIPGGSSGPLGDQPDPAVWGQPTTSFEGADCELNKHFKNQHIVIDTTLCGIWAGGTWVSSGCAAGTGFETCEGYVKNKPEDFRSAFWTFKSLKVFA
ncbi:hypothetical protein QM012_002528 [Aureobasidium pullulans]|uniref:GH16 domain-containing protein n=1 Tax=Aureobasidium pullulans TaxID=5580 RepID=A0ABR0TC59_AURPU